MADLVEMKEIWFEYYRCYLGELFNSYTLGKYKWKVTKTFLWKWKGKESFYVLLWEKLPLHWFSMACAMQREKQPFQMFRSLLNNQSLRKDDFDIMVRKIQMDGRLLSMLPCILWKVTLGKWNGEKERLSPLEHVPLNALEGCRVAHHQLVASLVAHLCISSSFWSIGPHRGLDISQ